MHPGFFYMPQIYFPSEGRRAEDFYRPLKIQRLRPGLNPRTWVSEASTLPLHHRSRCKFKNKTPVTQLTECIYVFCKDLNTKHRLLAYTTLSGFITEKECAYCAVRSEYEIKLSLVLVFKRVRLSLYRL